MGKEKELTLVDSADRIVTVKKPVERIVALFSGVVETMRSFKATDKIVGVDKYTIGDKAFFPEFSGYPNVDSTSSPNYEVVLSCDPDVVFLLATGPTGPGPYEEIQNKLKELDPSIIVIRFDCYKPPSYINEVRKLGYILDKEEETNEYIDFYKGFMDKIKEEIEGLSEGDKPKVYLESWLSPYRACGGGTTYHGCAVAAGGNNIFGHLSSYPIVDAEEVINRNPEIIVKSEYYACGDDKDVGDTSKLKEIREEIMSRPELQKVKAVKDGNVYVLAVHIGGRPRHFVAIGYLAKWFHPYLFEDLDPKAIHHEYLTRFQGLDVNLDEKGVFAYPEEQV